MRTPSSLSIAWKFFQRTWLWEMFWLTPVWLLTGLTAGYPYFPATWWLPVADTVNFGFFVVLGTVPFVALYWVLIWNPAHRYLPKSPTDYVLSQAIRSNSLEEIVQVYSKLNYTQAGAELLASSMTTGVVELLRVLLLLPWANSTLEPTTENVLGYLLWIVAAFMGVTTLSAAVQPAFRRGETKAKLRRMLSSYYSEGSEPGSSPTQVDSNNIGAQYPATGGPELPAFQLQPAATPDSPQGVTATPTLADRKPWLLR